jgi:hypothetical protein
MTSANDDLETNVSALAEIGPRVGRFIEPYFSRPGRIGVALVNEFEVAPARYASLTGLFLFLGADRAR